MPLIRKPEMFHYAAECYNRLNEGKKAVEMLNAVRQARGLDIQYNLPETLSSDEIEQEILKEWQKEYIGEGQMFYYYMKARNVDASPLQQEQLMTEIIREYRREFFGEGQMFYYYKRLGLPIPNATAGGDAAFILPLPKNEVEMGGREDYKNDK